MKALWALFVFPLVKPGIFGGLLINFDPFFEVFDHVRERWIGGQIVDLVRIFIEIIKFEHGTVYITVKGSFTNRVAFTHCRLQSPRAPQVRGCWIGQLPSDVVKEFIFARSDHSHRIIVGNLVEGMRGKDLVSPFLGIGVVENGQNTFAQKLFRFFHW